MVEEPVTGGVSETPIIAGDENDDESLLPKTMRELDYVCNGVIAAARGEDTQEDEDETTYQTPLDTSFLILASKKHNQKAKILLLAPGNFIASVAAAQQQKSQMQPDLQRVT
ncbi:hypothetical protein R6Q59_014701 [Mikania micrantha]